MRRARGDDHVLGMAGRCRSRARASRPAPRAAAARRRDSRSGSRPRAPRQRAPRRCEVACRNRARRAPGAGCAALRPRAPPRRSSPGPGRKPYGTPRGRRRAGACAIPPGRVGVGDRGNLTTRETRGGRSARGSPWRHTPCLSPASATHRHSQGGTSRVQVRPARHLGPPDGVSGHRGLGFRVPGLSASGTPGLARLAGLLRGQPGRPGQRLPPRGPAARPPGHRPAGGRAAGPARAKVLPPQCIFQSCGAPLPPDPRLRRLARPTSPTPSRPPD